MNHNGISNIDSLFYKPQNNKYVQLNMYNYYNSDHRIFNFELNINFSN